MVNNFQKPPTNNKMYETIVQSNSSNVNWSDLNRIDRARNIRFSVAQLMHSGNLTGSKHF